MERLPTTEPARHRRRWTLAEYEQFVDIGVIHPDERLELIEGEVVEKVSPQKSTHATGIRLVEEALRDAFSHGFDVRVQLPLRIPPDSEPEPDVAVVPGRPRDYRNAHPTQATLVVEVSDVTLREDRRTKAGLYAKAGIPEYWILNIPARLLEVHRDPSPMAEEPFGHHYRTVRHYVETEMVTPLGSEHAISVADLLP